MLAISAVSLLIFLALRKNIAHVTAGYLKIAGEQNKELVKPASLKIFVALYFAVLVLLPIVFYFFVLPHG